jgi:hypothetical protein
MAKFNACFLAVTGRAKGLQIGKFEAQFRMGANGLDMIGFKPRNRTAFDASKAVAALA